MIVCDCVCAQVEERLAQFNLMMIINDVVVVCAQVEERLSQFR